MKAKPSLTRREFVVAGTAATAATAISTPALASAPTAAGSNRLPGPTVAMIIRSPADPTKARLSPHPHTSTSSSPLTNPSITLKPLPCISDRLEKHASITIELYHPAPRLYSILYNAHNITLPSKSVPVFPAAIRTDAPSNALAQTTLRITQTTSHASQSNRITIPTASPGSYLLAIPTAGYSSNANWRFTAAHLDKTGQVTKLTNPLPAGSSRCVYLSITVE